MYVIKYKRYLYIGVGGIKAALQDGQGLQQKYNPPAIFGIQSAQAPAGAGHHQGYVHPGTNMGPGELSLLKQRASGAVEVDDIWRQALQVGLCTSA